MGRKLTNCIIGAAIVAAASCASYVITAALCYGSLKDYSRAHVIDVNEDGKKDIIIESPLGDNVIYLQDEEGNYKVLNKVIDEDDEERERKIKSIENRAEALAK